MTAPFEEMLRALTEVSLRAHTEATALAAAAAVLSARVPLRAIEWVGDDEGAFVSLRYAEGALVRARRGSLLGADAPRVIALPLAREAPRSWALLTLDGATLDGDAREGVASALRVVFHHAAMIQRVGEVSRRAHHDNRHLRERLQRTEGADEAVARSAAMRTIMEDTVPLLARHGVPVLLRGESGVGKDVVARRIHALSPRASRPFVEVNCGALPEQLVESLLFGHERGAFTGATARHAGSFERAQGGTLLLNEVGELPLAAQARLLRVLQTGEYERVGGEQTLRADVRVIAATLRDLEQMIAAATFRLDLYYRLRVVEIAIPALRDRPEDIDPLVPVFLRRAAERYGLTVPPVSDATLRALRARPWPGNARQLENELTAALLRSRGDTLELPEEARPMPGGPARSGDEPIETLDAAMRAHIERALRRTGDKVYGDDGAAKLLGLRPSTLQSRMKKLGMRG